MIAELSQTVNGYYHRFHFQPLFKKEKDPLLSSKHGIEKAHEFELTHASELSG
jgi:hypothetical protein